MLRLFDLAFGSLALSSPLTPEHESAKLLYTFSYYRKKLEMIIEVGQPYTTRKSGITGIVQEIIEKPHGYVLRLDVDGVERYTTV